MKGEYYTCDRCGVDDRQLRYYTVNIPRLWKDQEGQIKEHHFCYKCYALLLKNLLKFWEKSKE